MQGRILDGTQSNYASPARFLPFFLILISYEEYKMGAPDSCRRWIDDELTDCLARYLNQKSALGAYPIRLRTNFCFLLFCDFGDGKKSSVVVDDYGFEPRRFVVGSRSGDYLISGYRPFPPSLYGKLTTFFQIVFVFRSCSPRRIHIRTGKK